VQQRFLSGFSLPPARLLDRLLDTVDGQRHVAIVAAAPAAASPVPAPPSWPDPTCVPVAITRFVRADEDPSTAHVACTVIDAWHGRGVGTLLMKELIKHARALGITAFTATVAGDNAGSLRVLEKAGRVDRWERAGALIEVDIAFPEEGS
jgi:RimJ/RimL family protein N-acetyltransferase